MQASILKHREEIEQLCRHFHVRRLEIFGSALRSDFHPETSDLDFLVEFSPETSAHYADDYFGLKESLEALFERPVDLVSIAAMQNPFFREAVERNKALLYAA